jgi:agmatine deiminase
MAENFDVLSHAVDQDGRALRVVKVPIPDLLVWEHRLGAEDLNRFQCEDEALRVGDRVHVVGAASYLNYVITNGVILLPRYWRPGLPEGTRGKDEEMGRILGAFSPRRKIVRISPESLNFFGGGMHCITQQEPMPPRGTGGVAASGRRSWSR